MKGCAFANGCNSNRLNKIGVLEFLFYCVLSVGFFLKWLRRQKQNQWCLLLLTAFQRELQRYSCNLIFQFARSIVVELPAELYLCKTRRVTFYEYWWIHMFVFVLIPPPFLLLSLSVPQALAFSASSPSPSKSASFVILVHHHRQHLLSALTAF